jgi:hypothetical protein
MDGRNKMAPAGETAKARSYDDGEGINLGQNGSIAGAGSKARIKPETFCGDLRNLPAALAPLIERPH